MQKQKMLISDERIFKLIEWSIGQGIARNETEFLKMIAFPRTNISNVRSGIQHFTRDHIYNACKLTGASADYIFGFTSQMLRKPAKNALEMLKEAVAVAEIELNKRKPKP